MDYRYQEALRKSRIFLIQNIIFRDIIDHIIEQDIFSNGTLEYIQAGGVNSDCVRKLLNCLNRRPNECFDKFLTALRKAGLHHCVQRVTKEYVRSGPTQISDKQSLATAGPLSREYFRDKSRFYPMDSTPRGLVLIINNEKFDHMSDRPGSQKDQQNLHDLFHHLGFKIIHETNKTAEEMFNLMSSFAQYEKLKDVDALAVIILSHGGHQGIIYGTDGSHKDNNYQNFIKEEEIQMAFSARNCPLMASKPKLFIIQACRGINEDTADGVGGEIKPMNISFANKNLEADGSSARTADMADMCLIHSTVQGYVSYRHPQNGSPFVKEFTEVFGNNATNESLTDMMTEVTHRLSSQQLQGDLRTVPSYTLTLTKKWFLNPMTSDHPRSSYQSSVA